LYFSIFYGILTEVSSCSLVKEGGQDVLTDYRRRPGHECLVGFSVRPGRLPRGNGDRGVVARHPRHPEFRSEKSLVSLAGDQALLF